MSESGGGIVLLQGPPGTGKTTTILGVLSALLALPRPRGLAKPARPTASVKKPNLGGSTLPSLTPSPSKTPPTRHRRLLLVAPSNAALDEIIRRLLSEGVIDPTTGCTRLLHNPEASHASATSRIVRLGDSTNFSTAAMNVSLERLVNARKAANAGPNHGTEAIRQSILREAEIVCATCAGAGMELLVEFAKVERRAANGLGAFDAVLCDEATQATEPALLIALSHHAPLAVLVGDDQQLPPTVRSDAAKHAGLHVSTFERLNGRGGHALVHCYPLTDQYRMHPAISAFPSQYFYQSKLVDRVAASSRPAPEGFPWPQPAQPVCVVRVHDGVEENNGGHRQKRKRQEGASAALDRAVSPLNDPADIGSLSNTAEARVVAACVRRLLASKVHGGAGAALRPGDIGIVTPYRRQVDVIKSELAAAISREHALEIEVCTVDSFQGREKEAILVSCVRAQEAGAAGARQQRAEIGFLADGRRMNVALTRARRGLIVACHPHTLRAAALQSGSSGNGGQQPAQQRGDGAQCLAALLDSAEKRGLALDASAVVA